MPSDNVAMRTSARSGVAFYERKSDNHKWTFFQFVPYGIDRFEDEIKRARFIADLARERFLRQNGWSGYESIATEITASDGEIPYSFPKSMRFVEYFGGMTARVATVHLLVRANDEAEAQDTISAILSEYGSGAIIDWSYAEDHVGNQADPSPYFISADYEEGGFAASQEERIHGGGG